MKRQKLIAGETLNEIESKMEFAGMRLSMLNIAHHFDRKKHRKDGTWVVRLNFRPLTYKESATVARILSHL
jgi:hypothetical protein